MQHKIVVIILMLYASGWSYPLGWRDEVKVSLSPAWNYSHCEITTNKSDMIHCAFRKVGGEPTYCWDPMHGGSTNTGLDWTNHSLPGPYNPHRPDSSSMDITAISNLVFVVWETNMKVYSSKSTDNGETWLERKSISDELAHWSQNPRIVIDGSYLQTIFADDRVNPYNNFEIFHSISTDWGNTWSDNDPVTVADWNSWHPAMTCNGSAVHIVWGDNRIETNYEIYYNRSEDHCNSWVYEDQGHRLTSIAGSINRVRPGN